MKTARRREFAIPFVLVVGCGASAAPATTTTSERLPPPPGSGAVTRSTTEDGILKLTYESGDRIYVHKDGTCHAEYNSNCGGSEPEVTTCNPPPPQQVKCPADAK